MKAHLEIIVFSLFFYLSLILEILVAGVEAGECIAKKTILAERSNTLVNQKRESPKIRLTDSKFQFWVEQPKEWNSAETVAIDDHNPKALKAKPGKGILVSGRRGIAGNLLSLEDYGDIEGHFEFMIPQKSNSGIYLMGRYELQIFDSFGVEKPGFTDCGAIYARGHGKNKYEGHPPLVNASRPAGEWQSFDFVFLAPRFDKNGKKTANARFELVRHNGIVVQKDVQVTGPTYEAPFDDEKPLGPLLIQGDHGPIAYRNCWVRSLSTAVRQSTKHAPKNASKSTTSTR